MGGTKLYSSWSSKKSKKITSGTVAKYSKTPVISLTGSNFKNTISWNKLSGAAGYEVSYKKGAKGAWTVLKRTSTLKITHSVTHGVYYYYRVRAYQDKPDGSRIYGNYSEEESLIQYYSPSYRAIMTGKTYTSTSVVVMAVVNYGDCNMTLYARNARLFDHDYSSFNRNLQLVNEDLEPISSVKIAPGDTEIICFLVRGSATWVDKKTSIYYEFKYDGMDYYAFSSYYAGTYYYKNN